MPLRPKETAEGKPAKMGEESMPRKQHGAKDNRGIAEPGRLRRPAQLNLMGYKKAFGVDPEICLALGKLLSDSHFFNVPVRINSAELW